MDAHVPLPDVIQGNEEAIGQLALANGSQRVQKMFLDALLLGVEFDMGDELARHSLGHEWDVFFGHDHLECDPMCIGTLFWLPDDVQNRADVHNAHVRPTGRVAKGVEVRPDEVDQALRSRRTVLVELGHELDHGRDPAILGHGHAPRSRPNKRGDVYVLGLSRDVALWADQRVFGLVIVE